MPIRRGVGSSEHLFPVHINHLGLELSVWATSDRKVCVLAALRCEITVCLTPSSSVCRQPRSERVCAVTSRLRVERVQYKMWWCVIKRLAEHNYPLESLDYDPCESGTNVTPPWFILVLSECHENSGKQTCYYDVHGGLNTISVLYLTLYMCTIWSPYLWED